MAILYEVRVLHFAVSVGSAEWKLNLSQHVVFRLRPRQKLSETFIGIGIGYVFRYGSLITLLTELRNEHIHTHE